MPLQSSIFTKTRDGYIIAIEEILLNENSIFLNGKEINKLPLAFYRLSISDAADLFAILKEYKIPGFINSCKSLGLPYVEIQKKKIPGVK